MVRMIKTKAQRFTIKYKFNNPGLKEPEYGIVIYERCGLTSALQQFYEKLSGKERIEILDIESEFLYEKVES